MKPTFLLLILLSAVKIRCSEIPAYEDEEENKGLFSNIPDWFVQFMSPEGAKMLEKINKPRESRRIDFGHIARLSTHREFNKVLNEVDLGETESESEVEYYKINYVGDILDFNHDVDDDGMASHIIYDLNEKLFEAAVAAVNFNRLRQLFEKKKHLLLDSEMKARIMKRALNACSRLPDNIDDYSSIFKMLLRYNFYPKQNGLLDHSYDSSFSFFGVIRDPRLYQPFLDYDKDIFAKQTEVNNVSALIIYCFPDWALTALKLGFDPRILWNGRNSLDVALDNPQLKLTKKEECSRQELVEILINEFKMEPSNTIANLNYLCTFQYWDRAIELIKKGEMEIGHISPIGVAFESRNIKLINAAIETYLNKVPIDILKSDLSYLNRHSFIDIKKFMLIEAAAEKVKEQIEKLE